MPSKNLVTQAGPGIYFLDSRRWDSFGPSGVYLLVGDGVTLIETCTALIAPKILDAVEELGFRSQDVHSAIVTHIHLDHAGAAGWLVKRIPHLRVYVHQRGLKHLADPTQLLESAKILYGSLENIHQIHGDILPVPASNLTPVLEGELEIGGRKLKTFDAPGHAPHHLGIFDQSTGGVFTGEALGHYLPESSLIYPAVAPPGFHYQKSKATINRIRELAPRFIYFSQFGAHTEPEYVLEEAGRQLDFYHDFIRDRLDKQAQPEKIARELVKDFYKRDLNFDTDDMTMLISLVLGYKIYFERQDAAQE